MGTTVCLIDMNSTASARMQLFSPGLLLGRQFCVQPHLPCLLKAKGSVTQSSHMELCECMESSPSRTIPVLLCPGVGEAWELEDQKFPLSAHPSSLLLSVEFLSVCAETEK